MDPRAPISSLPFAISKSGSYCLASDLVGASGEHGITISADDVSIDLNGYALIGGQGSQRGIHVSGARRNISVRHGTIRNWGSSGVDLGNATNTILSDLRVSNNGGVGISSGDTSVVTECTSRDNNGDNIQTGPNSSVARCTAVGSATGHGINLGTSSVTSHCTANFNNQHGIKAFLRCRVSECIAYNNCQSGINISNIGAVQNCICDSNGFCGILSDAGGLVDIIDNYCSGNGTVGANMGAGIRVANASGHRIEHNNLALNYRGLDVLSVRNVVLRNVAAANTHGNFSIVAGNSVGPIVNVNGTGDLANAAHSDHPAANLEY